MLPGIIYQKATGSQILDSEAQTKTVTKNQMGKWAQASCFLTNVLSHHALSVLGSGIQRMRNTRLPCCTLSFQKPQQKSHWPFPWASWGAGLLLTHRVPVQIFRRYYPPCMHADPQTVASQVGDAFFSVTQASAKVHSLVSDTWAWFNPPWSPVVWIRLYSIFIEKNFPVNVSYPTGCFKEIFILSLSGHGECRVQILNAWQRILLCIKGIKVQRGQRIWLRSYRHQIAELSFELFQVKPRWVPKVQVRCFLSLWP